MIKGDRSFRRRLMELGISSLHGARIIRRKNGHILKVRSATYAIGIDGVKIVMEILNESR